ncbi:GDSL esterase/lipase At2g30310-like [Cucurbita pepo subsp. pepo]|uniref:GDSL esterase/lipase At2g30310-like n=1 Tax=Cucurbita pepo subsp. pepo TaxID=3664 RepID=UPI000C9D7A66|nr:GDSL esterase/lipase At2g30310-like [Cucurbita pepo subsp. pepo]
MKQIDLFKNYIQRLQGIVGVDQSRRIIDNALVVISAGTNEIYHLGCRYTVVAGLPPVGCLPIQETISFRNPLHRVRFEDKNSDSKDYNQKLSKLLSNLQSQLHRSTILYAGIYTPLIDMVINPKKYGFEHIEKGCCGIGLVEAGPLCNVIIPTCKDPSKFMFWDSIHPTEAAYKFVTTSLLKQFLNHLNLNGWYFS